MLFASIYLNQYQLEPAQFGLVPTSEPFNKRIQQGLILATDGSKMSKSKGNTVDPMKYVSEYGADVSRLGQMFMGDYVATKPWILYILRWLCYQVLQTDLLKS